MTTDTYATPAISVTVLDHPVGTSGCMSAWPAMKANRFFAALFRLAWQQKCQSRSHRTLCRDGLLEVVFGHHDGSEIRSQMLARIDPNTGLRPEDL